MTRAAADRKMTWKNRLNESTTAVPKKIVLGSRAFTKDNVQQGGEAIP